MWNDDIEEKQFSIIITHIENPHRFWFRYAEDFGPEVSVIPLEDEIEKYAVDFLAKNKHETYLPDDNCVVAVKYSGWNKWIRAKFIEAEDSTIRMWSIDHGYQLDVSTKVDKIIPLENSNLANAKVTNVCLGGLRVMPAVTALNVETLLVEKVKAKEWSNEAIKSLRDFVANADELNFTCKWKNNGHQFGDLEVIVYADDYTISAANVLIDGGCAVLSKNFSKDIMESDTSGTTFEYEPPQVCARYVHNMMRNEEARKASKVLDIDTGWEIQRMKNNPQIVDSYIDMTSANATSDRFSYHGRHIHQSQAESGSVSPINRNFHIAPTEPIASTSSQRVENTKKLDNNKIAVITDYEIEPTQTIEGTFYFHEDIRNYLLQHKYTRITEIQAHAWPHIMRGNSLILLNDNKTTNNRMCLPAFCSIVMREMTATQEVETDNGGITTIALASTVQRAKRLKKSLAELLPGANVQHLIKFDDLEEVLNMISIERIDTLVTTPFYMLQLVKVLPKIFESNEMRHVWFDQIDKMCEINEAYVTSILNAMYADENALPVLVTSQQYLSNLECIFHMVKASDPSLLIDVNASFEAALLADIRLNVKFIKSDKKLNDLIVELIEMTGSAVIICADQNEVEQVSAFLQHCAVIHSSMTERAASNETVVEKWVQQTKHPRKRNLLICTDSHLLVHKIRLAQHLIHFSLPSDLQTFLRRFHSSLKFYSSTLSRRLVSDTFNPDYDVPTSIVYFDEQLRNQSLDIFEQLRRSGDYEMPPLLCDTFTEMKKQAEIKKSMCPLLLLTTTRKCDTKCPYRHALKPHIECSLPKKGLAKFKLLEVLAPNHFALRLLAHRRRPTSSWQPFNERTDWHQFNDAFVAHYTDERNFKVLAPIEMSDLCVVFLDHEPYRCRVFQKPKNVVIVYLIDVGKTYGCNPTELLQLDAAFIDYPAQAIEVYLVDIKPIDSDPSWSSSVTYFVDNCCESLKYGQSDDYITAEIVTSFEQTMLVENFKVNKVLSKEKRQQLTLAHELIKNRYAAHRQIVLHDIFNRDNGGSSSTASNVMEVSFATTQSMEQAEKPMSDKSAPHDRIADSSVQTLSDDSDEEGAQDSVEKSAAESNDLIDFTSLEDVCRVNPTENTEPNQGESEASGDSNRLLIDLSGTERGDNEMTSFYQNAKIVSSYGDL